MRISDAVTLLLNRVAGTGRSNTQVRLARPSYCSLPGFVTEALDSAALAHELYSSLRANRNLSGEDAFSPRQKSRKLLRREFR